MMKRADAARWLLTHDRFAIVTHRGPDGDTVGSAAALCRGLRQLGKHAHVLVNSQVPLKYEYLLEGLTKPRAEENDTVITVDVPAPHMISVDSADLMERIDLRIDHHSSSTAFGEKELVDGAAAACGEIVYDLLMEMRARLDIPMADALYTAVSTDTGCFRYHNTTSHSYLVAAACKEVSPNLSDIARELFDTVTLGRLRLQGWIVEHLQLLKGGTVAICAIPLKLKEQLGLTEADMENISGFPRSIAGVKLAATLREEEEGPVKLSVRAVPGYDAAAVCEKFGGGGHKGAAGAGLDMTLDEALEAVKAAMQ